MAHRAPGAVPGSTRGLSVRSVTTTIIDLPSLRPHRFAGLEMKHQSYLLVKVETADGFVGVGEGVSPGGPWWGGEGIESQQAMVESHLGPLLVGLDEVRLPTVVQQLDAVAHANPFAKAALEMALFDAMGKRLGLPVSALLGGGPARDRLPVRWAVGAASADNVVEEGRDRLRSGHHGLKLKMGALAPRQDLARVAAIIERLGPGVDVLVDPNGTWDRRAATWMVDELEQLGVTTVEQPVDRDDVAGLAHLTARATTISIMADEAICRPLDALRVAPTGACDAVAVKVAKAGGLVRGMTVGGICAAAGLRCYGGTALESSLGTAASAHLFSVLPDLSMGCELVGPLLLTDDVVTTPLRYEDGELVVPTGRGLGVEIDWAKVEEHRRLP
jgi:muconate/chloromuconate cycloisomerase